MGVSIPPQGGPPPPDIPALSAEMAAWLKRGGIISPNDKLAEYGIHLPNGTRVGGEFSDEEMAAYMDAYRKLEAMKLQANLAPVVRTALARAQQRPDALAGTNAPTSGENPLTVAQDMLTMASPAIPGGYKQEDLLGNKPRQLKLSRKAPPVALTPVK